MTYTIQYYSWLYSSDTFSLGFDFPVLKYNKVIVNLYLITKLLLFINEDVKVGILMLQQMTFNNEGILIFLLYLLYLLLDKTYLQTNKTILFRKIYILVKKPYKQNMLSLNTYIFNNKLNNIEFFIEKQLRWNWDKCAILIQDNINMVPT